jgi:hypothetical protein
MCAPRPAALRRAGTCHQHRKARAVPMTDALRGRRPCTELHSSDLDPQVTFLGAADPPPSDRENISDQRAPANPARRLMQAIQPPRPRICFEKGGSLSSRLPASGIKRSTISLQNRRPVALLAQSCTDQALIPREIRTGPAFAGAPLEQFRQYALISPRWDDLPRSGEYVHGDRE